MALEGTIKDFGLPDIFQLIGMQRKTGLLTLSNESDTVMVSFENGMVVGADSSQRRFEDRLGSVLVKQGKLAKESLEDALQTQRQTLQRLGHVLAANSYITAKDLREALQVQVSQIVFKVFRWRDGQYHFEPQDQIDWDRDNFTPMSADFILMEGIRMVDEWPIIEKKIPSMDLVFRPVVDAALIEVASGSDDEAAGGPSEQKRAASASNKIRLAQEEERIFRKVDGLRTVQAIIDITGASEFDACRTLFDLLNRNIIATAGRGEAREGFEEREPSPASALPGYLTLVFAVAIGTAGVLAQRTTPFAVLGTRPVLRDSSERIYQSVSLARLRQIDRAVRAWGLATGAPPKTLEVLVKARVLDAGALIDPWERPYHYVPSAPGYSLSLVDDRGREVPSSVIKRSSTEG